MSRHISLVLFAALVLVVLCGSATLGQVTTVPDEGVRGSGAIKTSTNNVGVFDINVARSGNILFGGFKYQELTSTNTRGHTIYSQQITGLKIVGNTATIAAVGYWNGMLSDLIVEVLDDLNMDNFHITARPRKPIDIIYDQQGGLIKGDIVVYSKPVVPYGYVKGEGAIAVSNRSIGKFTVFAECTGNAVKGSIYYVEYNSNAASVIERPKVKIYVPEVTRLTIAGNEAVFAGKGTVNGKPALIEVKAKDNSVVVSPIPVPDQFYIKAMPLYNDSFSRVVYEAGGPLKVGDIIIKTVNAIQ